jgi:hypothetical protein
LSRAPSGYVAVVPRAAVFRVMKWRIVRFSLVALSTFVAGAVTVAAAWYLKQELAEQNEVRS